MSTYKWKTIELLVANGVDAGQIDCMRLKDKVAMEYLYEVVFMHPVSKKIKVVAKALHPSKAWRLAFEKLNKDLEK